MTKYKRYLTLIVVLVLAFTSGCNTLTSSKQNNSTHNFRQNVPQYVKKLSTLLSEKDIKVNYTPTLTLEKVPESSSKPYTFPVKRNFPQSWIKSELEWPLGKDPNSTYGRFTLSYFDKNYILEQVYSNDFKKIVLKLYKRKSVETPLPKELTQDDYKLVKVLDKAPDKGPMPQNQDYAVSENFVVWIASSLDTCADWTVWAYDIKNDKTFPVITHIDYPTPQEVVPHFQFSCDSSNILVISVRTKDKSDILVYNLSKKSIKPIMSSRKYLFDALMLSDGNIYLSRKKLYSQSVENMENYASDLVVFDIKSETEKTLIPKEANLAASDANKSEITFAANPPNSEFKDIWIFDIKAKEIKCYARIRLQDPGRRISVASGDRNIFFVIFGHGPEVHYIYRLKDKKLYSTGPTISISKDRSYFIVAKNEYDLFYPPPPFDYPGKELRIKGFIRFLIVEPD